MRRREGEEWEDIEERRDGKVNDHDRERENVGGATAFSQKRGQLNECEGM
jgi:hypothetical protein